MRKGCIFRVVKLTACGLSFCVWMMLNAPARSQAPDLTDDLPVLYGIRLDSTRMAIDVASSGCTDASYFSAQADPISADIYNLSIMQTKRDRCRMSVHIITVFLDLPEIPNRERARFSLKNRLEAADTLLRTDP